MKNNIKKQRSSPYYHLKRNITHPTQLPIYLGVLWIPLAFLIVPPIISRFKLSVENYLIIFIPSIFLFGLGGYYMVRLNKYIDHRGDLINGFPAKIFGYLVMTIWWGSGLVLIATFVFRW